MMGILQPGCSLAVPGQCNAAQQAAIANFRGMLLGNISTLVNATPGDGYFLHACWQVRRRRRRSSACVQSNLVRKHAFSLFYCVADAAQY